MKINKHVFKNSNTKFKDKKLFFFDNYPNFINIFIISSKWIKIYNKDAKYLSIFLNIKLLKLNDGDKYCLEDINSLNKIKYLLNQNKKNYNIIDVDNNIYTTYEFEKNKIYVQDKKENSTKNVNDNSNNVKRVSIGNKVTIKNLKTNEEEIYKIVKAYYTAKPVGISRSRKSWGKIISKPKMIIDHSIENNEINSESPFAKALLDCYEGQKVNLKDKDGSDAEYIIKSIN